MLLRTDLSNRSMRSAQIPFGKLAMLTFRRRSRRVCVFATACFVAFASVDSRAGDPPLFSTPPLVQVAPGTGYFVWCGEKLRLDQKLGTQRQIKSNWCWVACIVGVLQYFDVDVDQADIVKWWHGSDIDKAAITPDVIGWLSKSLVYSKNGQAFSIQAAFLSNNGRPDLIAAITYLAADIPLLIGVGPPAGSPIGHAVVLTMVEYQYLPDGTKSIKRCFVRDPMTPQVRKELTWDEIQRISFIAAIRPFRVQQVQQVQQLATPAPTLAFPSPLHPDLSVPRLAFPSPTYPDLSVPRLASP
jgi:Peptidase_C39 like family